MKWLEQCDLFMAEVSGASFGLGFETGYLLGATTKKVVLFYRRDVESKISLLITGMTHPNCRVAPYSDLEEVEIWIRNNLIQISTSSRSEYGATLQFGWVMPVIRRDILDSTSRR